MRSSFLLSIALCTLIACTAVGITDRYGQQYDSYASYLARARSINEDILVRLQPLPGPLGDNAVIVVPTSEHLRMLAEASYVGPEQYRDDPRIRAVINNNFDYNDLVWSFFPRDIERRKIFNTITVIHADSMDGIIAPKDGYLVWGERHRVGNAMTDSFHAIANGEAHMSDLPESYLSGRDEFDSTQRLLGLIEDFARTHRPQP